MPIVLDKDLYNLVKMKADTIYKKPSAYKSGFIVKKYKELGGTYSNDGKPKELKRWFKEEWKDIGGKDYPVYRPTKRISSKTPLTASEIDQKQAKKQIELKQKIKGKSNLPPFKGAGNRPPRVFPEELTNPETIKVRMKGLEERIAILTRQLNNMRQFATRDRRQIQVMESIEIDISKLAEEYNKLRDKLQEIENPITQNPTAAPPTAAPSSGTGIHKGENYYIQSVVFDKSMFDVKSARDWLKKNNYVDKGPDVTDTQIRFRQVNPTYIKNKGFDKFRTKKIGRKSGISLIISYK
jgi:hypothetical protein